MRKNIFSGIKDSLGLLEWIRNDRSLDFILDTITKRAAEFNIYNKLYDISIKEINVLPKDSNYHCIVKMEITENPFTLIVFEYSLMKKLLALNLNVTVHSFIRGEKLKLCFVLNDLKKDYNDSLALLFSKYHKDIFKDAIEQIINLPTAALAVIRQSAQLRLKNWEGQLSIVSIGIGKKAIRYGDIRDIALSSEMGGLLERIYEVCHPRVMYEFPTTLADTYFLIPIAKTTDFSFIIN